MTLDLSNCTLSYKINEKEKFIAFKDITVNSDIEYCLAVYIGMKGDCVELVSCTLSE